jgi:hypothetical protein
VLEVLITTEPGKYTVAKRQEQEEGMCNFQLAQKMNITQQLVKSSPFYCESANILHWFHAYSKNISSELFYEESDSEEEVQHRGKRSDRSLEREEKRRKKEEQERQKEREKARKEWEKTYYS